MKKRYAVFVILSVLFCSSQIFAQTTFEDFWSKFKTAVSKKDVNAVTALTKLPLTMPYGMTGVKTKAQLTSRFSTIFNGEANAAKCFAAEKPERETANRYIVACGFKNDKSGGGGKPIVYTFEKTKTGWKFTGLDNINE